MFSIAIVFSFALMVFLPCAVALIGSREPREKLESAYADRLVDQVVKPRAGAVSSTIAPPPQAEETVAATNPLAEPGDTRDPLAPTRGPRPQHGRVERAEIAALQARAVAARAHAEALAAVADAAAAKAEAAAADAYELEQDAAHAIQEMRRAA